MAVLAAAIVMGCGSNSAVTTTGPTQSKCQVALASPSASMGPDGGTGSVTVTTSPECPWDVTSGVSWVSGLTPASGQGDGTVSFQVAPNPQPMPRDGDIVVNDDRVTVSQQAAPCRFDLQPASLTVPAAGGTPQLAVSTDGACAWRLATDVGWMAFASPEAGSGAGTVALRVAPNSGRNARVGTIAVGDAQVVVTQLGAIPDPTCAYSIAVTTVFPLPAAGGVGTVAVSTTPACTWSAAGTAPWIAVTSGAAGQGSGVATFSVGGNPGGARSAALAVAGHVVAVTQEAAALPCAYAISPRSAAIPEAGGTQTVSVTAAAGCTWTADTNDAWITVVSGARGSGDGTVTVSVAANSSGARVGTVGIAGQTFTVSQAASPAPCAYTIAPTAASIPETGGTQTVSVSAGAGCAWTAAANDAWITVVSGAGGSGNGTVTFGVAANTGGARTGSLTIAGQTFTVTQAAFVCTFTVSPTSFTFTDAGGSGTVTVSASAGCAWTAQRNDGWITLTSGGSGSGDGTVSFAVDDRKGRSDRTGTLTIAGTLVTVLQRGRP
ncbi:MAG: BACON domain-containing carbohydrate-binding protein [Vicinamibacterales bacterium]